MIIISETSILINHLLFLRRRWCLEIKWEPWPKRICHYSICFRQNVHF